MASDDFGGFTQMSQIPGDIYPLEGGSTKNNRDGADDEMTRFCCHRFPSVE